MVLVATHKPMHWECLERRRVITLSMGRVMRNIMMGGAYKLVKSLFCHYGVGFWLQPFVFAGEH